MTRKILTPSADVCRQMGVSEAAFYVWKKKYGLLSVTADLTLDKHVLSEALRKKCEADTSPRAGPLVSGHF